MNIQKRHFAMFANVLDAYVPTLWANQSLAILVENMVIPDLINTDFSSIVASFGDTINTRRPSRFVAMNKVKNTNVTVQDAIATNVQIKLDQHIHVSFSMDDEDLSKAFLDLVNIYLRPAVLALARRADRMLLAQMYRFIGNSYGLLGGLTSSNAPSYILGTRKVMDKNLAPEDPRYLIHSPDAETQILNNAIFQQAYSVGDKGEALRKATLGEKLGFEHFKCQNASAVTVPTSAQSSVGLINHTAGYAVGATVFVVDGFVSSGAEVAAGNWIVIAGDQTPLHVTAVSLTSTTITGITVAAPGLKTAVADDAVITVNNGTTTTATYAAGYCLPVAVTASANLEVGQMISFNTDANVYGIVDVNPNGVSNTIQLDRPLVNGNTSGDTVNPGPNGTYSFAFNPNCLTWIVRPLALVPEGSGARCGYASLGNGLTVRITFQYQGLSQGMLVTLDFLTGFQVLDLNLGAVMFG